MNRESILSSILYFLELKNFYINKHISKHGTLYFANIFLICVPIESHINLGGNRIDALKPAL